MNKPIFKEHRHQYVTDIYSIYDNADLTHETDLKLDCTLYAFDDDNTTTSVTVLTPEQLRTEFLRYSNRKFLFWSNLSEEAITPITHFRQAWRSFLNRMQHNIDIIYSSLLKEYSPIENTDKYVKIEDKHTGTDTTTKTGTDALQHGLTNTNSGTDTNTLTLNTTEKLDNGLVITNQKTGFNSPSDFSDNEKTSNSGDDITTRTGTETTQFVNGRVSTNSGTDTTTHNTSDATLYNSIMTHIERTHGNIGVTTNMYMIGQEIEKRINNAIDWTIKNFIDTYTYY